MNTTQLMLNLRRAAEALITRKISFEIDLIPFEFEDLPLKKVLNWIRTEGSVFAKPSRPWGLPTILQVEPTNRCNLRCQVCPVATGLNRPRGDMDLSMFKRIIDELSNYLMLLMFWDWGEPFLNKDAHEMIRYARGAGIKVICSTNGHVFAEGDHARKVVESGLDVLVFSVDGITQETYQRFRTQGRLESVLEGIRRVVAEKRRLRSDTPVVNLRFIVMKHGEQEIPHLREFAQSLGVDVLTLRKFYAIPNSLRGEDSRERELLPSQSRYQMPALSVEDTQPVRLDRNPCKNLWNCPTLHWDGTVCSCFTDAREVRPLGSAQEQSFRDIWHGRAYRDLRRQFRENWQNLMLCDECGCGFEGGDVGRDSNAEAVFFSEQKQSPQQERKEEDLS